VTLITEPNLKPGRIKRAERGHYEGYLKGQSGSAEEIDEDGTDGGFINDRADARESSGSSRAP
jgi:hypothetical protein